MTRFDLNEYPLCTALITPMTSNGQIDYPALSELVCQQQLAGNGILLLGSTGEGLALSSEEHRNIVEYVVSLSPKVPLMVAVGGFDLQHQVQWIEYCNQLPIDAFLLSSPIYARPGKYGQMMWYCELLRSAQKPCMIYNVPSRSGVNLEASTLSKLCDFTNFWAIKEASGDLERFHQYRMACPGVKLFSGDDALFPQHAADLAAGLVSVCSNAWPQATRRYVDFHLNNRNEPLETPWSKALERLGVAANPIPVKVLMHQMDVINTPILRSPLTHLELENEESLLDANDSIKSWLSQAGSMLTHNLNTNITTQE